MPTYEMLRDFKLDKDEEKYTDRYTSQILSNVNLEYVISKIKSVCETSGKDKAVLLCYEGKGSFCHRHLVSKWLRENGFDVQEL